MVKNNFLLSNISLVSLVSRNKLIWSYVFETNPVKLIT